MSPPHDVAVETPPPVARPSPAADAQCLSPGVAHLLGWAVVASVNQVLIARQGLSLPASLRLSHHAYDVGQLLAAGLLSFGLVELAHHLAARRGIPAIATWPRALVLGLACFAICLFTIRPDIANAAFRFRIPIRLALIGAALMFGLLLAAIPFLASALGRLTRALSLLVGLAGSVLNAFVLLGDYPAVHLLIAWFSAALIAEGVAGLLPAPKLARTPRRVLLGALVLLSLAAVVLPPSPAVLGRLYSLPSSVLPPFLAQLYPDQPGPSLELVHPRYLASPWFQGREQLPPVAPTRALVLPKPRSVVLLTVDALRADVVIKPEYLQRFPGFATLRKNCAYFLQARTAASSTRASLATMFTGRLHSQINYDLKRFEHRGPMLAELLTSAGVKTVSVPHEKRIRAAAGVGRGFATEIKDDLRVAGIIDKVMELIGPTETSFVFAHIGEPHAPYKGEGPRFERYLQEVGRVDKELLRLFEFLKESGRAKNTLLIVTADHGEGFGEHGVNYHSRIIYEEVARVPLVLCGPGIAGRDISQMVSLIDMAPTILDAFELPAPGTYMGQSLLGLAMGAKVSLERPIAINATRGLDGLYLHDGKKVIIDIHGKSVEVYDVNKDPGELENLVASPDPAVLSAIETTRLFFHQHRAALAREFPPSEAEAEALAQERD